MNLLAMTSVEIDSWLAESICKFFTNQESIKDFRMRRTTPSHYSTEGSQGKHEPVSVTTGLEPVVTPLARNIEEINIEYMRGDGWAGYYAVLPLHTPRGCSPFALRAFPIWPPEHQSCATSEMIARPVPNVPLEPRPFLSGQEFFHWSRPRRVHNQTVCVPGNRATCQDRVGKAGIATTSRLQKTCP